MNILDTVLFGMLAGIITLKVALIATAAVLLVYALMEPIRQRKAAPEVFLVKQPGPNVHV
jgi:hypothetical protein